MPVCRAATTGFHPPGAPLTEPSEYLVQGRMGVLGQIYGVVDFGIVKAEQQVHKTSVGQAKGIEYAEAFRYISFNTPRIPVEAAE